MLGLALFRLALPSVVLGITLFHAFLMFTVSLSLLISGNSFATEMVGALPCLRGAPKPCPLCSGLGPALPMVLGLRWASREPGVPLMDGLVSRVVACPQSSLALNKCYILNEVTREGRRDDLWVRSFCSFSSYGDVFCPRSLSYSMFSDLYTSEEFVGTVKHECW